MVQVQQFGTGASHCLEILHQSDERVKTESQEVLTANSYVCISYRGKTGAGEGQDFLYALPILLGSLLHIECGNGNFLHLVLVLHKLLQIQKAVDIFVYI